MEKNKSDIKAVAVNQSCFFCVKGMVRGEKEQNDNFHGWGDCESSRWEEERRPDHVTSPHSSFICAARRIFFVWLRVCVECCRLCWGSGDFAGDSYIQSMQDSRIKQLQ
jgi:hypothetical protein